MKPIQRKVEKKNKQPSKKRVKASTSATNDHTPWQTQVHADDDQYPEMVIPLQWNRKRSVLMDNGQILPHLSVAPTEHQKCNFNELSNTRKRRPTKRTNSDQAESLILQQSKRQMGNDKSSTLQQSERQTGKDKSSSTPRKKRQKGNNRIPHAIGMLNVPESRYILPEETPCQYCQACKFKYESDGLCCQGGQIKIATNPAPEELIRLLTKEDEDAVHFRQYIRLYNNLFAFSSIGGHTDSKARKGVYVFKLQGQLYHYVPDLLPADEEPPKYLQLYFYDPQQEIDLRSGLFNEIRADIVAKLIRVIEENPYAQFFRSLRSMVVEENTTVAINRDSVPDQRTYNAPTSNQVAGILVDNVADMSNHGPHILVHGKSNKKHQIRHYYGCYDPLQYPIIFPLGDCGWHPGLKKVDDNIKKVVVPDTEQEDVPNSNIEEVVIASNSGTFTNDVPNTRRISCRQYYAYKLQIRSEDCSYLLRMGRLFQQYLIDMYVKLENTRLDFYRKNQKAIRAELYQGLLDSINQGETSGGNVGHRIILPPSFVGGPRDMKRRFLNALTLVQKYGKPDLFITMTCNPNWPEIKNNLAKGERAENRPDLEARIFHSKLVHLSKLIMEKKIFGDVAAKIQVVEFQKRGLPHAHLLVILHKKWKIKNPDQFDKYVSAEIPGTELTYLRSLVVQHMMHGPCGSHNPNCACMEQQGKSKVCRFSFPKPFAEVTTTNKDSYPTYRRRDNGEKVHIRGMDMDNRWVIPYNPYLLAMFDCHINVEVCSTIKAVKYLYKYVYKGHDKVSFKVASTSNESTSDEIENFQSVRWISPPEAVWRIFGFELYNMTPPVVSLPVHTPDMQTVQFSSVEDLQDVIADSRRTKTMLTQFFKKNSEAGNGKKFLYQEFPEHFTWNGKRKEWVKRSRGIAIGRLTYASPMEGERYYLRLLLVNVSGPTSFRDLLTVRGKLCLTFQEAALEHKLLEGDNVVECCMNEGVTIEMPHVLRKLFATLLVFCEPANPKKLWAQFYEDFSEDFRYRLKGNESLILGKTAKSIQLSLENMGKSLADFNLSHVLEAWSEAMDCTRDITDALNAPIPHELINLRKKLNAEQKKAYKEIIHHVKHNKGGAFFIDGPGGTGKTFLYCALYARVRQLGKIVLPTAASGIAAANIPTGRTAHSRFKIPVDHENGLACNVGKQSGLAALLRQTSLIIWDEASMSHKQNIEALDLLLQDLCNSTDLFGGKTIVFGGDFRQVLPVLQHKTQAEAVDASLVSSMLWSHLKKFQLIENMRAKEDPQFSKFLLDLGDGKLQKETYGYVTLPGFLKPRLKAIEHALEEMIAELWPQSVNTVLNPDQFTGTAILAPRNEEADEINAYIIGKFPGQGVIYKSFDTISDGEAANYPPEFLHTLCPGGMPLHELTLKENCPAILLRNIDPSSGLCNGTRLICKQFFPNLIRCEIACGQHKGSIVLLPRIIMKPSPSSNFPLQLERKQFPIKLSFAMTINKAQGQTLQQVSIYLKEPCFSHGQLYVALSRARKFEQLTIYVDEESDKISYAPSLRNIVAFEVLIRAGILQSN